jgi:hypothetical protein
VNDPARNRKLTLAISSTSISLQPAAHGMGGAGRGKLGHGYMVERVNGRFAPAAAPAIEDERWSTCEQ